MLLTNTGVCHLLVIHRLLRNTGSLGMLLRNTVQCFKRLLRLLLRN